MSKIDVAGFFQTVQEKHATGQATEHSYRPALEKLLQSINPDLTVINEPKHIRDIGKPDFVIMRDDVPVGYVEAKDVGLDIRKMKGTNKEQQTRYVEGLPNLIYTNGLDFDFYRWDVNGEPSRVASVTIGDYLMGLQPNKTQFAVLQDHLYDFVAQDRQALTITSANRLAKIMARKGRLMRHSFGKALVADEDNKTDLAAQYLAFQDSLIHDITKASFADIYAETIVYGMFAARYHDQTPEDFSRQEALELLPKSNPFLRKLFTFISSNDLPREIEWTIEELVDVYRATNVKNIMSRWSDANDKRDPFLHFYETFLAEYNPAKRKSRGVWYTPEAVVNFIVRAVDDVLKTEFNEPMGLASPNKIQVQVKTGTKEVGRGKGKKRREDVYETQELHRVQILDPATGTGTFLAEVINQIEPRIKAVDEGGWSDYVENDLKPRLHGFELLMASYAMCHLKLDMMLTDKGYVPPEDPKRLSVWLTNSLEEPQEDDNSLPLFGLARAISEEAKGANEVKTDKPIMCIIGNPPYSGESANKGPWIMDLLKAYKKEPGGLERLKEHNSKWINDDYVKFIRFSEHMINESGEGVLAFITNHGYLDNPTFRGMRWHLLSSFDKIHIVDLHGSQKKGEQNPSGGKDENVFDIMPGVSIIIAIKQTPNKNLAEVYHSELWGTRKEKSETLRVKDYRDGSKLAINENRYDLLHRDYKEFGKYELGFSLNNLFNFNILGSLSKNDSLIVNIDKQALVDFTNDVKSLNLSELANKYTIKKDSRDWKLGLAKDDILSNPSLEILKFNYRPFDKRHCLWSPKTRGVQAYPKPELKYQLNENENFALIFFRQLAVLPFHHCFVTDVLPEQCYASGKSREGGSVAPLYLYPDENDLDQTRKVNMDTKIRKAIEDSAEHPDHGRPDEVAIFDYIYGVLHCPAYRETYAEFLKIDFPRVPYPSSPDRFWDIAAKGKELRELHLMDGVDPGMAYPFKEAFALDEEEKHRVGKIGKDSFKSGNGDIGDVYINDGQYFEGVPRTAWEFYIGGYQPAQKWLKDRRGRKLSFDDRMHYRKIIHILMETDRIMKTIEMDL